MSKRTTEEMEGRIIALETELAYLQDKYLDIRNDDFVSSDMKGELSDQIIALSNEIKSRRYITNAQFDSKFIGPLMARMISKLEGNEYEFFVADVYYSRNKKDSDGSFKPQRYSMKAALIMPKAEAKTSYHISELSKTATRPYQILRDTPHCILGIVRNRDLEKLTSANLSPRLESQMFSYGNHEYVSGLVGKLMKNRSLFNSIQLSNDEVERSLQSSIDGIKISCSETGRTPQTLYKKMKPVI